MLDIVGQTFDDSSDRDVRANARRPDQVVRFMPVRDILDRCTSKTERVFDERTGHVALLARAS